jgi:hypothetical protein
VPLEAGLELGRTIDLARDQHRPVEEKRGLTLLDDLEARAFQGQAARGGELRGIEARRLILRRLQNSGWISTGRPLRPSARATPSIPELDPALLVPAHCTGWKAVHQLAARLPDAFIQAAVGTTIEL